MSIQGKRVVVLMGTQYHEMELWYPVLSLREAGAEVRLAGVGEGTRMSKYGQVSTGEIPVNEIEPDAFDALVVPGGFPPDSANSYEDIRRLVREAFEQGKLIAAICHSGQVLASAGVLRGRRATCGRNVRDGITEAGAIYVDDEVVRDGNLITSRTPPNLPAFCRKIIEALSQAS